MIRNGRIAFTGTLDTLTRTQAQVLVFALGGMAQSSVSTSTTVLVIEKAYTSLFKEDTRSSKMQKADKLREKGIPICFLSEKEFLEAVTHQLNQIKQLVD